MTVSKNDIKRITALHQSKFRNEQNRFLVEGVKIVDELLTSSYKVVCIYALEPWMQTKSASLAIKNGIQIFTVSPSILERISQLKTPNLVIAEVEKPNQSFEIDLHDTVLTLDRINDPGNMGTIIRTADWFGIRQIVCSEDCVELYNSKVLQATMGSFLRVNMIYTNLEKWMQKLTDENPIYGAVMDGENFYDTKIEKTPVFLIGNESKGISESLKPLISKKITIPRFGKAESLNASIATAVILSRFRNS